MHMAQFWCKLGGRGKGKRNWIHQWADHLAMNSRTSKRASNCHGNQENAVLPCNMPPRVCYDLLSYGISGIAVEVEGQSTEVEAVV